MRARGQALCEWMVVVGLVALAALTAVAVYGSPRRVDPLGVMGQALEEQVGAELTGTGLGGGVAPDLAASASGEAASALHMRVRRPIRHEER